MTSKVASFRAQQKLESENQKLEVLQPASNTSSEIKGLLSSPPQIKNGLKSNTENSAKNPENPKGLQVTLEQGILSVNDPKFDQRDKSVNQDLEWVIDLKKDP